MSSDFLVDKWRKVDLQSYICPFNASRIPPDDRLSMRMLRALMPNYPTLLQQLFGSQSNWRKPL